MNKLFFDIETIPSPEEHRKTHLEILRKKKAATTAPKSDEELHMGTSFEGTFGRICAIAYIKENGSTDKIILTGDEKGILEKFWAASADVDLFVGHNIMDFDFPFIYKRSIIMGVKPRTDISFARYRNQPIFDTMKEWEKWGKGANKLDTLAKVLGLPTSKDLMDGSEVWPYFQSGKIKEIGEYCMKDVELTRQVYYKMVFEDIPT